jgi:hypothetical protein
MIADQRPCYDSFYDAVDAFLRERGFHSCLRRDNVNDGHMARHFVSEIRASANSEHNLVELLRYMEAHMPSMESSIFD